MTFFPVGEQLRQRPPKRQRILRELFALFWNRCLQDRQVLFGNEQEGIYRFWGGSWEDWCVCEVHLSSPQLSDQFYLSDCNQGNTTAKANTPPQSLGTHFAVGYLTYQDNEEKYES